MPSTVVHVAFGGIVAAALLGRAFGARSLAVVLAFAALPDLDTFLGLVVEGGHRAVLHTLLLPVALAALLAYDRWVREKSVLRERRGDRAGRVAGVGVAALAFAGIGPDLFTNGVNVLYPLHDEFFRLNGELLLSNERGLVQTFVEFRSPAESAPGSQSVAGTSVGSTDGTHYSTGVDPEPGAEEGNVERVFPVVAAGWQLLIVLTSAFVVTTRLWETRRERRP